MTCYQTAISETATYGNLKRNKKCFRSSVIISIFPDTHLCLWMGDVGIFRLNRFKLHLV